MRVPFQASHEERGTNETGSLPELLLSFEVSERFSVNGKRAFATEVL